MNSRLFRSTILLVFAALALLGCSGGGDSGSSSGIGINKTYYKDADGDGYGNPAVSTVSTTTPAGYVANGTDCNDADAAIFPSAMDILDSKDNDCDVTVDEDVWYKDADGDKFGDGSIFQPSKFPITGFVTNNTDCDDNSSAINPNALEGTAADGTDNDCDGMIDEGISKLYYADVDGDQFGDPSVSQRTDTQPLGFVADNTDCNDADASVNPTVEEILGDGTDNNCNGKVDERSMSVTGHYYFDTDDAMVVYPSRLDTFIRVTDKGTATGITDLVSSSFAGFENTLAITEKEHFLKAGNAINEDASYLLSTILLIDVSTSIDAEEFAKLKMAAKRFVADYDTTSDNPVLENGKLKSRLLPSQRIMVAYFDDAQTIKQDWTSDPEKLVNAIDAIKQGGPSTDLCNAFLFSFAQFSETYRYHHYNLGNIVAFTEGQDTANGKLEDVLKAQGGKVVHAISPLHFDPTKLSRIARTGFVVRLEDFPNDVEAAVQKVKEDVNGLPGSMYYVRYASPARWEGKIPFALSLKDNLNDETDKTAVWQFNPIGFSSVVPEVVVDGLDEVELDSTVELRADTYWVYGKPAYTWTVEKLNPADPDVISVTPIADTNKAMIRGLSYGVAKVRVTDTVNKYYDFTLPATYEKPVEKTFYVSVGKKDPKTGMYFVWVDPGTSVTEIDGAPVTVAQGFWISKKEVSRDLVHSVFPTLLLANLPAGFEAPVTDFSVSGANLFVTLLDGSGKYRLPTLSEWRWAALGGLYSAGFTYAGSDNYNDVAHIALNNAGFPRPCGEKLPNELGIYDMSGNAAEIVTDAAGNFSVGGSIDSLPPAAALNSKTLISTEGESGFGFRLVIPDRNAL